MMNEEYILKSIKAAIKAGDAVLEVYHSEFEVEHKSDNSPLTLADKRSHEIIDRELQGFDIPVLSEEGKNIPYEERKHWRRLWIIDPLDGTKEFINRNGEFTINIALIEAGKPVLGVVLVPVKRKLYFAADSLGSFKIDMSKVDAMAMGSMKQLLGCSLRLSSDATNSEETNRAENIPLKLKSKRRPYTIVGSRSHSTPELKAFVEEQRKKYSDLEFVSAGSSLKFCLVAEKLADVYPRLGPTMEWDTAAGHAIAENAGAEVLCYDTNSPLIYNKEELLNPWFVVQYKLNQPS